MLDLEAALNAASEKLAEAMQAAEADPDFPDLSVQSLQKAHDTVDRLSRNYPHFKMRSEIQRRLTA